MSKLFWVLVLSVAVTFSFAQPTEPEDSWKIRYGFTLGATYTIPNLTRSDWNQPPINYNDSLTDIAAEGAPGVIIGITADYRLSDKLILQTQPSLSFFSFSVLYNRINGSKDKLNFENTALEFPLYVQYRFPQLGYEPTIAVGPSYKLGLAGSIGQQIVDWWAMELTVGLEKRLKFFSIFPELRYSHGWGNLLGTGDDLYSNTVEKITPQTISLLLNFK